MKGRINQMMRWICTKGLVWLGFGATPFIFMACYGPVPTNYQEADFADEVVDTTEVTRSADEVEGDIASEDVADDSLSTEDQV
jgi:hypothetical protein